MTMTATLNHQKKSQKKKNFFFCKEEMQAYPTGQILYVPFNKSQMNKSRLVMTIA